MSRTSIYKNPARQEERRRQREQEKQKRALQNAVKATLPAYNPGGNLRLGEDVIIANVNEWQQKATAAAAKAEERAQSALAAESHGDMKVASVFWGDSWSYDQKAKNFSAEALRYEAMLKPPKTAPKETPPATAPKTKSPVAAVEDKKRKETEITPAVTEPAVESTLQEMVKAYSAERAAILETAENRHVLEWGNAALKDQQVWQYIQHSGSNPDLDGLAVLMDGALAEYRTPTQSAGMDYAKKTANHVIGGEYTDDRTPLGSALSLTLGFTGADIFMDARDLGYDLTHLQTIPPGQLGLDALALIPGVGALKYADEGAALIKNGQRAAEAAGDMAKHGDALVDAGKAVNRLAESGTAAAEKAKLIDRLMEVGQRANKTLADTGNLGYSGEAITMRPTFSLISTQELTRNRKQMNELVESIAEHGILEPIKVVNVDDCLYVVDGHHRLRAAKLLQIDLVPVEEVFLPFNSSYRTVDDLQWKW